MLRFVVLIATLLFVSGCSMGRVGYYFGDWLIKREILSYVKLYQRQQEKLEVQLDEYMAWHKKVMMPRYVKDLAYLESKIKKNELKKEEAASELVREAFFMVKKRYIESAMPLAHRVSPILSTLNESQIQRTREILAKKFKTMQEEQKKYTYEVRLAMVKKNMEQWLGPLTPEQLSWLKEKVSIFNDPNMNKKRLAERGQRRKTFLDIFDEKDEAKRTQIQKDFWQAYEKKFMSLDDQMPAIKLIAELVSLMTPEQRMKLAGQMSHYRAMIENII